MGREAVGREGVGGRRGWSEERRGGKSIERGKMSLSRVMRRPAGHGQLLYKLPTAAQLVDNLSQFQ